MGRFASVPLSFSFGQGAKFSVLFPEGTDLTGSSVELRISEGTGAGRTVLFQTDDTDPAITVSAKQVDILLLTTSPSVPANGLYSTVEPGVWAFALDIGVNAASVDWRLQGEWQQAREEGPGNPPTSNINVTINDTPIVISFPAPASASAGVTSFNSRQGVVLPLAGDYPPALIGAEDISNKGIANGYAPLGADGIIPITNSQLFADFLSIFIPMTGVTDDTLDIYGEDRVIAPGVTGNSINQPVSNQHVGIFVNSITTGGAVEITGTSVSEINGVPVPGDTETITVDTSTGQLYLSDKKWIEYTLIDVSATTGMNYDVRSVGHYDASNVDYVIEFLRLDIRSSGANSDLRFKIVKYEAQGGKKFTEFMIEDIGIDSTGGDGSIIDHVRTGPDDRSYTATTGSIFASDTNMNLIKQNNYADYWTGGEAIIHGSTNEGLRIHFEGEPSGGLSAIDHATLTFSLLPIL